MPITSIWKEPLLSNKLAVEKILLETQDIIKGCCNNDRKCQRAFVDEYSPYLYGVCLRYLSNKDMAQDGLQESLIHILQNINKFKNTGSLKSWAAKVTANICLQIIRREKKYSYDSIEIADSHRVDESANLNLEKEDVLKFLDLLPEKYKIGINMYVIEGYNHKEIASILGITEGSSRSLVSRARKLLNEAFEKENTRVIKISKKNNNRDISYQSISKK